MKLLTYCIPTYNRANYLSVSLESLIKSIEFAKANDLVEIIICDNNSTDHTSEVVNSFSSDTISIKYYRNDTNTGAMKNFYKLVNLAETPYVCLFGDDDYIEPQATTEFLAYVKLEYDLIISDFSTWNRELTKKLKSSYFNLKIEKKLNSKNDILSALSVQLGYISIICFKKKLFSKLSYEAYLEEEKYGFSHLLALYFGLEINSKAIVLNKSLVRNRSGNSNDYNWENYFIKGTSSIFNQLQSIGYSHLSVLKAKNWLIKNYLIYYIVGCKRLKQKSNLKLIRLIINHYYLCYRFWLFALPILLTPQFLFNFYFKLKKRLTS